MPSRSSKRVFSTRITSPLFMLAIASSNCAPRVTGTNVTGLFKRSAKCSATGFKDKLALSSSVFTRPRCENRTAFPPFSVIYLIVGKAATIRLSSPITPSLIGTLKSTRIKTFLPSRSFKSSTVSLAMKENLQKILIDKPIYNKRREELPPPASNNLQKQVNDFSLS